MQASSLSRLDGEVSECGPIRGADQGGDQVGTWSERKTGPVHRALGANPTAMGCGLYATAADSTVLLCRARPAVQARVR